MSTHPSKQLDTFPNPNPERNYEIRMECPEFTCLCPKTGQPDFATFRLTYVPDRLCVELKSLKLYLWSFRDEGHFHEAVTNRVLDDLVAALQPRWLRVEGDFAVVTVPASSITTQSVKVPPISTPTRYEPILPPSRSVAAGFSGSGRCDCTGSARPPPSGSLIGRERRR